METHDPIPKPGDRDTSTPRSNAYATNNRIFRPTSLHAWPEILTVSLSINSEFIDR